ncbi:MAG: hypothetical protein EHM41_13845 [Chloroflexi bacterium]|nr:MAG: hypothetical protein EHM41_13845 [Chloroflexota bacterium]
MIEQIIYRRGVQLIALICAAVSFVSFLITLPARAQTNQPPSGYVDLDNLNQEPITTTQPLTIYRPVVSKSEPVIPVQETRLFCNTPNTSIPDNNPSGTVSSYFSDISSYIVDLNVYADISHTHPGDLSIFFYHQETGVSTLLMDRPGYPASSTGCGINDVVTIFDDQASLPVESKCTHTPIVSFAPGIGGRFLPETPLSVFHNESFWGNWTIQVIDENALDTGRLEEWCIEVTLSNVATNPVVPPTMPPLPNYAFLGNLYGLPQALPLDCESRSAVDWAAFFGKWINEFEFFNGLPKSDNPDIGFVGNVNGEWGQTPPQAYGVHAAPIAARLRQYGLPATAVRSFSWDEMRAEIAAGHPAEVWVIGAVKSGWPRYFRANDGKVTVVAPYEHTVVLTGYDLNNNQVWYLNGANTYNTSIEQFLDSWGVLGNMAIIYR